jgi:S-adenosylmethionine synthetase
VTAWLAHYLPRVLPHLQTRIALARGSAELVGIFAPRAGTEVVSNDTSGASGYAPLSATEQIVLAVETFVNGPTFKTAFPDTGQDAERAYFRRKDEILSALTKQFRNTPFETVWRLNNLDVAGRGTDGVYLTLTGTSAEDGDSGQVGRGNRANGLIAFARPSGGEASAGKNALAHAGKVYSVLSHHLARAVHTAVPGLAEVYVHLAARIGDPIDRPWTGIQLVLEDGVALPDIQPAIGQTVQAELEQLPEFRTRLARGEFPVC